MKSDNRGAVHFHVIDRAVGRRSLQLARGNLCVTDIPRAEKAECHTGELTGNLLMQQSENKKRQHKGEGQKAAPSVCII